MNYLHEDLTSKIIGCFYEVHGQLGYGFLERVYERALMIELNRCGILALRQHPIKVAYRGLIVGDYFADIVVEDKVILEVKSSEAILDEHECQLINYLKATRIEVGLLLNFGRKPEVRRKIFTNDRKGFPDSSI